MRKRLDEAKKKDSRKIAALTDVAASDASETNMFAENGDGESTMQASSTVGNSVMRPQTRQHGDSSMETATDGSTVDADSTKTEDSSTKTRSYT